MGTHHISKGYDVPVSGKPAETRVILKHGGFLGVTPSDFHNIKPKLLVKQDDQVKIGTPLFFDKNRPSLKFCSPASGRISAINFGPRRKLLDVVIRVDEQESHESAEAYSAQALQKMSREELASILMDAGLWPLIRQRPFNAIASGEDQPKAIFVNCAETAPHAAQPAIALSENQEAFSLGIVALRTFCTTIHLCMNELSQRSYFGKIQDVEYHVFSGKHPAGLVGTHISKISPINKGEKVWHVNAQAVVELGTFLGTGQWPTKRTIAISGPGAKTPQYATVRIGQRLGDITRDQLVTPKTRIISGNLLTGRDLGENGFLGFYDTTVSLISEAMDAEFLGWMMPGFSKPSFGRTFLSRLMPKKEYAIASNINGGHRAIIQSGLYEQVVALDVMPEFLLKAVLAEDLDLMEQLGILECDEEDFALCSYICPSKTDFCTIIRNGLNMIEKEG